MVVGAIVSGAAAGDGSGEVVDDPALGKPCGTAAALLRLRLAGVPLER